MRQTDDCFHGEREDLISWQCLRVRRRLRLRLKGASGSLACRPSLPTLPGKRDFASLISMAAGRVAAERDGEALGLTRLR